MKKHKKKERQQPRKSSKPADHPAIEALRPEIELATASVSASLAPSDEEEEIPFARQKSNAIVSFVCGLLFAVGLGLAGMTSPAKVLAFLDVTSAEWDPSLAFVMAAAVGVHFVFARRAAAAARAGKKPRSAPRFHLPAASAVDRSLLVGAAVFGIGWGLAGYCPGPALVAFIVTPIAVIFVGAMLAGIWGTRVVRERLEMRAENRATALAMERAIEEALKRDREPKEQVASR